MTRFVLVEYRDPESGETPKDALANEINRRPDQLRHLVRMAAFTGYLAADGQLGSRCVARVAPYDIQLWMHSEGKYHLIYSYYPAGQEVCLLKFFAGDYRQHVDDAKARLKRYYRI